jgi:hypothetical protein
MRHPLQRSAGSVPARTQNRKPEKWAGELGGTTYPSIALAGERLFVSSDTGKTIVLELGKELKQVAANTLEPFRSTPVFEGARMYVRTTNHLICIGQ